MKSLVLSAAAMCVMAGLAANAQDSASRYPSMAPLTAYTMADRDVEIALARSAAPPSISNDAEVRVLGAKGYETVVKGKNGFVCLVERSWAKDTTDPEFWNPKMRAPTCFNDASVRSYLPLTIKKTEWVLAGLSKEQIAAKLKSGFENGEFTAPPNGAIAYMMSKAGYLSDRDGHWHPHIMFYVPSEDPSQLGANLDNSPVYGVQDAEQHFDVIFIPVGHWSDDSPDSTMQH